MAPITYPAALSCSALKRLGVDDKAQRVKGQVDRDQVEELQGTIKDLGSRTPVSVWCSVELCACGVVGAGRLHEDDPELY